MEHDDHRNDIKLPSDRVFGIFFSLVFGILSVYTSYRDWSALGFLFAAIAICFLLMAIFLDTKLHFLNIMWLKVGILIGKVTNPIILGFVFFGLFTPMSLFFKLRRRDELFLRKDIRSSYWKFRKPPSPNPNSFQEMF
jgi:hypothetical protein